MVDPSALSFPASGTLAAWRQQLAPWQPAALWAGHLFYHRVETLVAMATPASIDRLAAMVLQALSLEKEGASLARLRQRLHLPEAMLNQTVQRLRSEELLTPCNLALTDAGRTAQAQGMYPRQAWQRAQFTFVERLDEAGRRAAPPHFLPIRAADAASWSGAPPFEQVWLSRAVEESSAWKETWDFPVAVRALADSVLSDVPAWQRVTLLSPQQITACLLVSQNGPIPRLLGFAAHGSMGPLHTSAPCFDLAARVREQLPEWTPEPNEGEVQAAWSAWCNGHGILPAHAVACPCLLEGLALRVQATPFVMHHLHVKHVGADQEEWLLIGGGPTRRVVQLQIVAN
jgi:hypothetical protein